MTQPKIKLAALDATQIADAKGVASSYLFGKKDSTTTGLTLGYYGGTLVVNGILTAIADGIVGPLTASTTNYVEATRTGIVSFNTLGFTAGQIPLFTVVTGVSTIITATDVRGSMHFKGISGRASLSVGSGSYAISDAQSRCDILNFVGILTADVTVDVPDGPIQYLVSNNTTGAFTLTVKTAAGTGVIIPQGMVHSVVADGTNVSESTTVPASQIVFGTTTGITSSSLLTYSTTNNEFLVNSPLVNNPNGRVLLSSSRNSSSVGNSTIHLTLPGASGSSQVLINGGNTTIVSQGGGGVNVQAGDSTLGTGGDTNILAGNGAQGGDLVLQGGAATATDGGQVTILGGNTDGSGQVSGNIVISAGRNTTVGVGGNIFVTGGAGGITSGNAGFVTIQGGIPVDGNGGNASVIGRNAVGTNRNGGNVIVTAGNFTGTGVGGTITFNTLGSTTQAQIDASGNVVVVGTGGLGYGTGSGGTVTQATSKSTGVTLNKTNGEIVMNNAALADNTTVSFTVTNSTVLATDVPFAVIKSGGTIGAYIVTTSAVAAGSFSISLRNESGGSLSEAVVLSFIVMRAVTA
jgi:hypothetical protein